MNVENKNEKLIRSVTIQYERWLGRDGDKPERTWDAETIEEEFEIKLFQDENGYYVIDDQCYSKKEKHWKTKKAGMNNFNKTVDFFLKEYLKAKILNDITY